MKSFQYSNITIWQYNNKKGITLIELVMVIVIVGILASASAMYIKETVDLWRFLSFRNELVSSGRMALVRMEREIRQIRNDTCVYRASAAEFNFTDMHNATINYRLSGNNLLRNSDVLVSGVSNLTFIYYNETNQAIANPDVYPDPTDIRRININLTIQSGTQTKALSSQAYPRNL